MYLFPTEVSVAVLLACVAVLLTTVVQDIQRIRERARMDPWQRAAMRQGNKRGFEVLNPHQRSSIKDAKEEKPDTADVPGE